MGISTFLNGRDQDSLRGLQFLALSESGWLLALTTASDSGGGASSSWTTGGTVPCRVDPITDRDSSRVTGGRIDERSTHVVTVPSGTPLVSTGRFVVSGRGTFEITAVHEQTAGWSRVFEVIDAS